MAWTGTLVYEYPFTAESIFTITHNLDKVNLRVRLIINDTDRSDLFQFAGFNILDPTNKIEVVLKSVQTGYVQVIESDVQILGGENLTGALGAARFQFMFGETGTIKNTFLAPGISTSSGNSTYVMPNSGSITGLAFSTESNPERNVIIHIIKNATKNGGGTYQGGTQIGADLTTSVSQLDDSFLGLTGYTFCKLDRISIYLEQGTGGTGTASSPICNLYIQFDNVTACTGGV